VLASLLVVASILLASCEPPVDPDDGETIGLVKLVSPEA
jgi:hypothetical protein